MSSRREAIGGKYVVRKVKHGEKEENSSIL